MPNPNNPVFPTAVATDATLMVASNRALSTLTLPIDNQQTTFTVADGTRFQTPCLVQIDTEIVYVGAKTGNVLQSCIRGFSLTSAVAHGQNADVKGYVFSYHHNQVAAEIKAIELGLGVNFGNVVMQYDQAGGDLTGVFTNLHLKPNGVVAGTYGGFNRNVQITVDNTGRITQINNATGNMNYPIIYKAAIVQGTNAVLGFSFGNTEASNAVPYYEANGAVYAVASFTQGNDYYVQDHFYLPDDWVGDTMSLDIYWRTSATTGTVTWNCACAGVRGGHTGDITFNSTAGVTTTVPGTANTVVKSRITPLLLSGVNPGDELFFNFSRNAGDTANATAELISIKFNIHRDFALVP